MMKTNIRRLSKLYKPFFGIGLVTVLLQSSVLADYLKMSRNATVRAKPDKHSPAVLKLSKNDKVAVIDTSQTNGYYHIKAVEHDGQTGWIYRTLGRRYQGQLHPSTEAVADTTVAPFSLEDFDTLQYYASVDTSSKETLRRTLHEVIDDHKRYPYTSNKIDTWDILELADEDPDDEDRVIDLYKNASYLKKGGGNDSYNREHSWPKSYGFPKDSSKNYPYTDCHHLFICNSAYNSSRNNKKYAFVDVSEAIVKPTEENNGRGGAEHVNFSEADDDWRWQVWEGRRGDVARALLYVDVRYEGGKHAKTNALEPDLKLTNETASIVAVPNNKRTANMGLLDVLLEWHKNDPVDYLELKRNDVIYQYQGNRNPFIDNPEWVELLFGVNEQ